MYRFELSYDLAGSGLRDQGATLVPHLLPTAPPDYAPQPPSDDTPRVRMTYRFGFLPTALMSRIIVRTLSRPISTPSPRNRSRSIRLPANG